MSSINSLVTIDVETTGLDPFSNGICSLGAVVVSDPSKTFYIEFNVPPETVISFKALEVNGFTRESITDPNLASYDEGAKAFTKWLASATTKRPQLMGWNVSFDRMFIENYLLEHVNPNMHYAWVDLASFASVWATTMTPEGKNISFGDVKYLGLFEACKIFGIEQEPPEHNALNGALKVAEVYKAIKNYTSTDLEEAW